MAFRYDETDLAPNRADNEPERYPCPAALSAYFRMGDYHLLRVGGIQDQPAGLFLAARYAGSIYRILEEESKASKELPIEDRITESEIKILKDKIRPFRQRLMRDG